MLVFKMMKKLLCLMLLINTIGYGAATDTLAEKKSNKRNSKVPIYTIIINALQSEAASNNAGLKWVGKNKFALKAEKFTAFYNRNGSSTEWRSIKNNLTKSKSGFYALKEIPPVGYTKVYSHKTWLPSGDNLPEVTPQEEQKIPSNKFNLLELITQGLAADDPLTGLAWLVRGQEFQVNINLFCNYYRKKLNIEAKNSSIMNRMTKSKTGFFRLKYGTPDDGYDKVFSYVTWQKSDDELAPTKSQYPDNIPQTEVLPEPAQPEQPTVLPNFYFQQFPGTTSQPEDAFQQDNFDLFDPNINANQEPVNLASPFVSSPIEFTQSPYRENSLKRVIDDEYYYNTKRTKLEPPQ